MQQSKPFASVHREHSEGQILFNLLIPADLIFETYSDCIETNCVLPSIRNSAKFYEFIVHASVPRCQQLSKDRVLQLYLTVQIIYRLQCFN